MGAELGSIGERIAFHRRHRRMPQAAVAGLLGRTEQWLPNIERGVRLADRYSVGALMGVFAFAESPKVDLFAMLDEALGDFGRRAAAVGKPDAAILALRLRTVTSGTPLAGPRRRPPQAPTAAP